LFPETPGRKIQRVFLFPEAPGTKIQRVFLFPKAPGRKIHAVFLFSKTLFKNGTQNIANVGIVTVQFSVETEE
jgi:hypothetical protein